MSSSLNTEASWRDDLIPVKVAYFSVAWSGIHRKQGLLYTQTAVALSFLAVKACTAELASAGCTAAQRWPYEITQDAASPLRLSHETGTQKPLCALPLVSPPSAWLTKPGCLSPAHQPRAPPDRDCLWKSLFSSLTVLSGAEAERGAVFFTTMWGKHAASCRSALASVLDSLFSVFLSFSASSLGLSTSQISSVETLRVTPETLRVLFRDAGSAGNAHAYGAECLVTGWTPGNGSEPDSTAVLHVHPEQKTVFLSFEFLTEAVQVPLRIQMPQRVTLRLCLDRRENDQKRIWPMLLKS